MNQDQELSATVGRLIEAYFPQLRRTVRKNLTRLTCAFLRLALSVRFGYGGLHLTSIARVLPQGANFKSSYKWLSRFLSPETPSQAAVASVIWNPRLAASRLRELISRWRCRAW